MKSSPIDRDTRSRRAERVVARITLTAFLATQPYAFAAPTDIANTPISSAATATLPPNVMFILDASGSMDGEFLPDEMDGHKGKASYASHLCNTIYFNPATTYAVPKDAGGNDFTASSFSGARNDGFHTFLSSGNTGDPSNLSSSGTTNLGTNYKGTTTSGTERAFYYQWNGASPPTTSECQGSAPSASRSFPHVTGNWQKVQISAAEEQNFANWFSFYRTRLLAMKTAAGRAFTTLNDQYRVGFITICPNGGSCDEDDDITPVTAAHYLAIDNFTATQKTNFYTKFYSQRPGGFTPLRQALARVGRHYAGLTTGINAGMTGDPIQYSCQQNFSILTTDGYWNYGRGKTLTNGSSGSGQIGNHDDNSGVSPRPMFDGGAVNSVVVERRINSRGSGSPTCTGQQRARVEERTITTPQFGTPNTSTTSVISNHCEPTVANGGPSLPTAWLVHSGPTLSGAGSTANTLADVAAFYYQTDLRSAMTNNVPSVGTGVEDDTATHQHMTTFTLGLGLSGQLTFDPNYKSQTVGDFADIRSGVKGWPDPNPGSANTSDVNEQKARIDDLWHAAVNGRGQYFSAGNPGALSAGLSTALSQIQARLSSAAAAATSTLEPTAGDNLIILPTYTTQDWTGELRGFGIDLNPASPTFRDLLPTPHWSAGAKLDQRTWPACDDRKIKLFSTAPSAVNKLVDFTWNTQLCDAAGNPVGSATTGLDATDQTFFNELGATDEVQDLTQWGLMTDGSSGTANQRAAARGANLVNFLRGQRGKEGFVPNDINKLYRARKHVLGDIVNSQPLYIRAAFASYLDTGYASFAASMASRAPMVYVAGNDGMVHAFTAPSDATGGVESWAFIPRSVLPRMYKLADTNYTNLHEYFVDGRPTSGDIFDTTSGTWKTILVGGLNKGGRGYYALDVTDPLAPKALWEFAHSPSVCGGAGQFADCHLGFTFGNPVISKLTDGRWVVFVTSGYNNVNAPPQTGDGQGYLYVLDAVTGQILYKIGTGAGSAATPSGLAKITAWVNNSAVDNTSLRVYGVDLLGNVWRFDVNDDTDALGNPTLPPAGREATLLATVRDPMGNPQPITVAARLAEVGVPPAPFVYVGTGKYLGATDVADTQVQSVYAIKDPLGATAYADLRVSLQQISLPLGTPRTATCGAGCDVNNGWFADLPDPGERVNVQMELQLGTLAVASNVPGNTACEPGGFGFLNFFDISTGLKPPGAADSQVRYRVTGLTVGMTLVRLPGGSVVVYRQKHTGEPPAKEDVPIGSGAPSSKRVTWREISQ